METFKAQPLSVENLEDLADALPPGQIGITYDPQRDNNARASFAVAALVAYRNVVRGDEDIETVLSDLLGDLRHLADVVGVDFDEANDRGRYHYDAEVIGD